MATRICEAHFGMNEVPCPHGCLETCVGAFPEKVNRELAAARKDAQINAENFATTNKALVSYDERRLKAEAVSRRAFFEAVEICRQKVKFPAGHRGQWEGYGPVETTRDGEGCAAAIIIHAKNKYGIDLPPPSGIVIPELKDCPPETSASTGGSNAAS